MGIAPNAPDLAVFYPSRFVADFKKLSSAINAPYSETTLHNILKAYHQYFRDFAVIWRATDRPGDVLNFRFLVGPGANVRNCHAIAVAEGFLKADNIMLPIIASWTALYENTSESCDFDAVKGLVKTWVYLGRLRPLDEILQARDVPESIRRHAPAFKRLGLTAVRIVCVNYESETVNIYLTAPGTISGFRDRIAELVALAGSPPPSEDDTREMRKWTNPEDIRIAVTIHAVTGAIDRVAVYATNLPDGETSKVEKRLAQFFECAPSYDDIEINIIAWSFGTGGSRYMKGERSYTGQVIHVLKAWNSR